MATEVPRSVPTIGEAPAAVAPPSVKVATAEAAAPSVEAAAAAVVARASSALPATSSLGTTAGVCEQPYRKHRHRHGDSKKGSKRT